MSSFRSAQSSEDELLTIASAARLIAARGLSPVELARYLLERIENLDPQVNAYITVTGELALEQARRAESEITHGGYRGALHGIPVGLKDIYNTKGNLTSANSRVYLENVPAEDAAATTKL